MMLRCMPLSRSKSETATLPLSPRLMWRESRFALFTMFRAGRLRQLAASNAAACLLCLPLTLAVRAAGSGASGSASKSGELFWTFQAFLLATKQAEYWSGIYNVRQIWSYWKVNWMWSIFKITNYKLFAQDVLQICFETSKNTSSASLVSYLCQHFTIFSTSDIVICNTNHTWWQYQII